MKRIYKSIAVAGLLLAACNQKPGSEKVSLESDMQKQSYAIGMDIGESLKNTSMEIDKAALDAGIAAVLDKDSKPLMTKEEAGKVRAAFFKGQQQKAMAERQAAAGKNKEAGEKFLAENARKDGVKTTASGLQYKVIKEGTGPKPAATDRVTVNYEGTLIDGTVFDSSYKRGKPVTFPLNQVIKGWTEGLQLMSEGSKYKLFIPSDLAYGARGAGNRIGPDETLIFTVELLGINKK